MLKTLSIRNIVLIESLDLDFSGGLSVLTGETGAGKSILLDSLGLATGARAESDLVRYGSNSGTVTAVFKIHKTSPVYQLLEEQGFSIEEEEIILRRQVLAEGGSRAFINDQAVSVQLLSQIGNLLIEVHGQHDDRGLLNSKGHRALLDAFAGNEKERKAVKQAYDAWQKAEEELSGYLSKLKTAQQEEEYNQHALDELDALAPQKGEEATLGDERALMQQAERSSEDLNAVADMLAVDGGVDASLRGAMRRLERIGGAVGERLAPVIEALHRSALEAEEAINTLARLQADMEFDPNRLEAVEERLFALRALARKHGCQVDDLSRIRDEFENLLTDLKQGEEGLKKRRQIVSDLCQTFEKSLNDLTESRQKAARELDTIVNRELPPLKLEKAKFQTTLTALNSEDWGANGAERVAFEVSTNPGAPFGSLQKIASGGELSRFILALKVALISAGSAPTLIFDEVDRGIGGAVADAVGERLAMLAHTAQVLVVTHSPQVAARGSHHWRIAKAEAGEKGVLTSVEALMREERREEIARMLSGASVSDEARAAAQKLMQADG